MDENIKKLEVSIENLKNKSAKIYFFVQDTKGNLTGSVRFIYQMALTLKRAGFNSMILHEKSDYVGVKECLGSEYMDELSHSSVEGNQLMVSPEDMIVVPELFGYVMQQISNLPCIKISLAQCYDYILDTLQPGTNWSQLNVNKCITTSESLKNYVSGMMKNTPTDVIEPYISERFVKQSIPPKPIIAIHSREQRDSMNVIKSFYLKYPQFRWFAFRDMRGLTEEQFAETFQECFLSVWIDPISSFGTFPLESMKCGVPVIGKIPNMAPSWMNEHNGIWIQDQNKIVDFIADFIQNWLEDNISEKLYESMEETSSLFSSKEKFENSVIENFQNYFDIRIEMIESQLNKLQTV